MRVTQLPVPAIRRMWKRLLYCLFRRGRHDYQLRREPDVLFLECIRCGYRSRGWNLSPSRVKRAGGPLRLVLAESFTAGDAVPALDRSSAPAWAPHSIPVGELRLTLADPARPSERRNGERRQKSTMNGPERRARHRRRLSNAWDGRDYVVIPGSIAPSPVGNLAIRS